METINRPCYLVDQKDHIYTLVLNNRSPVEIRVKREFVIIFTDPGLIDKTSDFSLILDVQDTSLYLHSSGENTPDIPIWAYKRDDAFRLERFFHQCLVRYPDILSDLKKDLKFNKLYKVVDHEW